MSDAGILKGYSDSTFQANKTMTRMEFIKVAVCSVKSEAEIDAMIADANRDMPDSDGATSNEYKNWCKDFDIQAERTNTKKASEFWGTRYLFAAYKLGITDGVAIVNISAVYNPGYAAEITREEACHFMYNTCTKVKKESLPVALGIQNIIPDVNDVGTVYYISVTACVSNGLIAGVDDNYTIEPKKTLTRAEAYAIAARIINPSRRVAKPVVPKDKQTRPVETATDREVITLTNPVTGEKITTTRGEWSHFIEDNYPMQDGRINGEKSADGWYTWDQGAEYWVPVVQ